MILNRLLFHKRFVIKAAQIAARSLHTSNPLTKNLYAVLGLTRDATQADIKNAYFELSKVYHPDRIAATDENLTRFREISDAYEILGNEQSRKLYDRGLMGDFKRPGTDDAEVVEPIIKFYKQRQEASKPKPRGEMEAWAESYYRQAKQKAFKKSQFYVLSKKAEVKQQKPQDEVLLFCIILIGSFLYCSNFKGTRAGRMWNNIFG